MVIELSMVLRIRVCLSDIDWPATVQEVRRRARHGLPVSRVMRLREVACSERFDA